MVPSEKLRNAIESAYHLPLSKYAWNDELKAKLFSIKLDKYIEDTVEILGEAYEYGLNIGHCGVTSRYFSIHYPNSMLHYGRLDILQGTKNARFGGHAWVEMDGYVLDPTLMIVLPKELKQEFGYHTERIVAKECSILLSEYDTYSNESHNSTRDPEEYENSLYSFEINNFR